MPASFPEEALKAQAVLARTFAVRRLNPLAPYDLCATEACQVYLGLSAETPRHERAVRATEGRVLSYAGQVASALYHADSGGMTAGSEEVFRKALPYLRPRPDPYAKGPKSVWQQAVRPEEAARALRALGYAPRGTTRPRSWRKALRGGPGGCASWGWRSGAPRPSACSASWACPPPWRSSRAGSPWAGGRGTAWASPSGGPRGWRSGATATGRSWGTTSRAPSSPPRGGGALGPCGSPRP